MPNRKKCISRLRKQYKDVDLSALEKIYDEIEGFQTAQKNLDLDPRITFDEFMDRKARVLAKQRARLANNVVITRQGFAKATNELFDDDPVEGILSVMGKSVRSAPDMGMNADLLQKLREIKLTNMLILGLEDLGLWKIAMKGKLNKEIFMEMAEIKPGGKPGISGSKEAQQIAELLHKVNDEIFDMMRRSGSQIDYIPGYIMKQTNDPSKVSKAKIDQWRQDIYPLLDKAKVFGEAFGNEDLENEILEDMFKAITEDSWSLGLGQFVDDSLASILDPHRIDNRLTKSRAIHFKDGESAFLYNEKYGRSDLMSSIHSAILKGSRASALFETLGSNPEAGLKRLMTKVQRHYSAKGNTDFAKKIKASEDEIMGLFKNVRGDTKRAGVSMKASISANVRAMQRIRLLGRALLATLGDIPASAVTIRSRTGDNLFSAHYKAIQAFTSQAVQPKQRREIGKRLNIVVNDFMGNFYNRWDTTDGAPGMMGKLQRGFFRLNGLSWQGINGKVSQAKVLAYALGERNKLSFAELPEYQSYSLSVYGIKDAEWSVIRNAAEEVEGLNILTPEAIRELDPNMFKELRGDRAISLKDLREQIAERYQAFISDAVDDAIPTPSAREDNFFNRGLSEDALWGFVARLMLQFKEVPLTLHRVHGRASFWGPKATARTWGDLKNFDQLSRLDKSTDFQNFLGFYISGLIFGYLALVANDLINGRMPSDPFDPETMKEAFVRGGAAGLRGDFALADYDDAHRNIIIDLAGPTGKSLKDLSTSLAKVRDIWQDGRDGKKIGWEFAKFAGSHTFPQNLIWSDLLLDYAFLNELKEHNEPGWAQRHKAKIESKQDYWEIFGVAPGDPTERLGQ